jgi:hypothetical protein
MRAGWSTHVVIAATVLLAAAASSVSASGRGATKPVELGIAVVAHVPLDGGPADQLFVREGLKNRILLYVVHESGRAISVVDITQPAHAALVKQVDADQPAMGGRVVTVGTNTLIVENTQTPVAEAPSHDKTVRFFDLSDPTVPRVALQFERVSTYVLDASRSLIYLVNDEGLWIVRHTEPMDWKTKAWWDFANAP